jgi:hypothetical protein
MMQFLMQSLGKRCHKEKKIERKGFPPGCLDSETKYHKPARVKIQGVPHFHHTPCSFVLAPNTYEFAHYFHQALEKEALSSDTILASINRTGTAPLLRPRKRRPPTTPLDPAQQLAPRED